MIKTLLLSNSTLPGGIFFAWPRPYVQSFLGKQQKNLVFIPFAAVTFSFDEYAALVRHAFSEIGFRIQSIHSVSDKPNAIREADGIVVGGGNSFALLRRMQDEGLLEPVQEKVKAGTPYIGWSAGANLACPTIMTTNDMPIIFPSSVQALKLVPFQINPHYHELRFENQGGETRKERLEEFLALNPEVTVIGLPEGMLIRREGDVYTLQGNGVAKLYRWNHPVKELHPGNLEVG